MKKILLIVLFVLSGCVNENLKTIDHYDDCEIKIALLNDSVAMNQSTFLTVEDAVYNIIDEVGLNHDCVLVESIDELDYLSAKLTELSDKNADLIIYPNEYFNTTIEKVAKHYPNNHFLLFNSDSELDNVLTINYKSYEMGYVAGVIAATKTVELGGHLVGYIGYQELSNFENLEGFKEGINFVNENIELLVNYTETNIDIDVSQSIALSMVEQGVNVLYENTGDSAIGILNEAKAWDDVFVISSTKSHREESYKEESESVILAYVFNDYFEPVQLNIKSLIEKNIDYKRLWDLGKNRVNILYNDDLIDASLQEELNKLIETFESK